MSTTVHDRRAGWAARLTRRLAAIWRGLAGGRAPGEAARAGADTARGGAAGAFSPTRAQAAPGRVVGRRNVVSQITAALLEEQAHVVLFSERGRGKTTVANLAVEALQARGAIVARYTCEADDTFDDMIRGLLRGLPKSALPAARRAKGEGCEGVLPARALRAGDVAALAGQLDGKRLVFVVDEFDRTQDLATRTRLADAMKLLSDRGAALHFVLVAVSATVEEILGEHPSVQRNLLALHLPLLADTEVATLIARGADQAELNFGEEASNLVIWVARGMPYMAQLLGLRIAQAALRRDARTVSLDDLDEALLRLIDETPAAAKAIYAALLDAPHEDMADVLQHLGAAQQDRFGALALQESSGEVMVGGVRVSRNAYAMLMAAGVLAKSLGETGTVHVGDRPVMNYVQLLAARERLAAYRDAVAA